MKKLTMVSQKNKDSHEGYAKHNPYHSILVLPTINPLSCGVTLLQSNIIPCPIDLTLCGLYNVSSDTPRKITNLVSFYCDIKNNRDNSSKLITLAGKVDLILYPFDKVSILTYQLIYKPKNLFQSVLNKWLKN